MRSMWVSWVGNCGAIPRVADSVVMPVTASVVSNTVAPIALSVVLAVRAPVTPNVQCRKLNIRARFGSSLSCVIICERFPHGFQ